MAETRMSRRNQSENKKSKKPKKKKSGAKKFFIGLFIVVLVLVFVVAGVAAKVYFDVSGSVKETYSPVQEKRQESEHTRTVDLENQEAFSVLLLGVDTGDLGRVDQGRSDTIMVATINPKNQTTTLVSVPRDTYVDIVGYGTQDKINHAYAFGGAAMSMDTVSNYLDIPIDHYVSINMAGIQELVDAVGGVDVNNDLAFTQDGYTFDIGPTHLGGEEALAFIRMRHEDPRGDYGRQLRQRLVVEGIVKKGLSLGGITQYQEILDTVEGNMQTDLSFSNMQKVVLNYRKSFNTFEQLQMQGEGFMQDGVSYQRVSEEELALVQEALKKELDID